MEKHESFAQMIERLREEGKVRVMDPWETLNDPEGFRKDMKKIREDYIRMANDSWRRVKDKILR